jgi:fibronectin type 3 domain-containing protein
LANIPVAVQDLGAVQRGALVLVDFTVPVATTENMPIRKALKLDLRIGTAGSPFDAGVWAAGARQISGAKYGNGMAHYEVPSAEWTGKSVTVGVRAIGSNGKASRWSNYVSLPVVAPPEKPGNVTVTDTPQGVHVAWTAHGDSFRVFRRSGDAGDFDLVATVEQPEWTDHAADFGKPYAYRVQAVVKLANGREAESDLSDPNGITPQDVFPPAVPSGVSASVAPSSIELTWNPNTEPTLGGYSVYRSTAGGAFEKIAAAVLIPAYSDRTAEHGKAYRYAVTAVSRTGHESPRSATVEITLP